MESVKKKKKSLQTKVQDQMALLEKSTKHTKNVHQSFSSYFKRLGSRERSQSHFVKLPSPCDQNQTETTKKNITSQYLWIYGRPDNSAGKESTCNAGDPSLISRVGRSPGEGSYLLQYSWASLVAQRVKNLPAMQEDLGLILCHREREENNNSYCYILDSSHT